MRSGGVMNGWTLESAGRLLDTADDTLRPGGLELTDYALSLCSIPDGSRILDAGCGTAATVRHLEKNGTWEAVGVDQSVTLLAEGRSHSRKVSLVRAVLESLPFGDESFEGVICECVLSQTCVTEVLSEFRRVLRPGGFLIISDLYRKTACTSVPADVSTDDTLAPKELTIAMLGDARFTVMHWEDRTSDLKRLAVRLIMSPGSSQENLFGWSRHGRCRSENVMCTGWRDVGYHLLVARRSA